MNKIALPADYIFEFQGDSNLVSNYLKESIPTVPFEKIDSKKSESPSYGYPVLENQQLFDWMNSCVEEVSTHYFELSEKFTIKICDVWMTKTEFMNVGLPHYHNSSIFSGLLYLQDSDVPTIFYVEPGVNDYYQKLFYQRFKHSAQFNTIQIYPKVGKLIVWPSFYLHSISSNRNRSDRYTLAFNTFFDGVIGDNRSNHLSIKLQPR